jgi:putative membrane protein
MSYLSGHWSVDAFVAVAIVAAAWYEAGMARLSAAERAAHRGMRSLLFYGGLAVLVLTTCSPISYWAYDYFFMHMVQHLLLMFAVPTLIVAAAPWRPLAAAIRGDRTASPAVASVPPAPAGSAGIGSAGIGSAGIGSAGAKSASTGSAGGARGEVLPAPRPGPVAAILRAPLRPWASVAIFNIVMILWHLPGPLDLAERNGAVHYLMYATFLVAGVLFWLQFIGSPPFRMRMHPASQAGALLLTNVIMWILAMALGILTNNSWYSAYNHIPGVTLPPFADQQIGAGILWICGDFWAIPAMIMVIKRLIAEDGSLQSAIDRMLGRGSERYQWVNRS